VRAVVATSVGHLTHQPLRRLAPVSSASRASTSASLQGGPAPPLPSRTANLPARVVTWGGLKYLRVCRSLHRPSFKPSVSTAGATIPRCSRPCRRSSPSSLWRDRCGWSTRTSSAPSSSPTAECTARRGWSAPSSTSSASPCPTKTRASGTCGWRFATRRARSRRPWVEPRPRVPRVARGRADLRSQRGSSSHASGPAPRGPPGCR
jgi:hypothetical protein